MAFSYLLFGSFDTLFEIESWKFGNEIESWKFGNLGRDRSASTMVLLLKSLIRPKLEYCSPLWSPCRVGDIAKIENIQRFFTRRIADCEGKNYWERLEYLQILSLQRRRERYMIIHLWKIYQGLAPNSTNTTFYVHQRHGPKANVPRLITTAQNQSRRYETIHLELKQPNSSIGCRTT